MKRVLKYRNQIYGLCAIWIIFFHIQRRIEFPDFPILTQLLKMGNVGVDVFMFLSGYCLCLSFKRNSNLRRFFRKRVSRVVIPYLIISIPYFLYRAFIVKQSLSFFKQCLTFAIDISGVSFWLKGFQTTWFVHAIIVLYCLFPLFYYIISKGKKVGITLMALIYLLILLCYFYLPSFDNNDIALCRFPVFILGIFMAYYGLGAFQTKRSLFISAIYVILIIWILPTKDFMYQHFRNGYAPLFIFFITMVIPLMALMAKVVEKLDAVSNRILLFIGGLSLEIYIIHVMVLNILRDCGIIEIELETDPIKGCLIYLFVPLLTIILSYISSEFVNKYIIKRYLE